MTSTGLVTVAKFGNCAASAAVGRRGQGLECQSQPGGGIGRHHARRTRVADHDQPAAGRTPALQIGLGGAHQLVHVGDAPDAVLPEERVDDAVLVGQRAGVRPRRRLTAHRATGLDRDDRHVALARHGRDPGQHRRVLDALDVEQQQAHGRVLDHGQGQLRQRHVRVVPGGVGVADADAALAQQPVRRDAHHAALADDADRAVGRLDLDEHRREAGDGAGPEIRQPLRIGPDDAHASGPGPHAPCRARPRPPTVSAISPKPDAITMAAPAPRAAQSSTARTTCPLGAATMTRSGASGSAPTSG